jgi:hypothetical protein
MNKKIKIKGKAHFHNLKNWAGFYQTASLDDFLEWIKQSVPKNAKNAEIRIDVDRGLHIADLSVSWKIKTSSKKIKNVKPKIKD